MNRGLIQQFVSEIIDDYEKYRNEKPLEEWFLDAIKRHIIDITEEEALSIRDKLIIGIRAYRTGKTSLQPEDIGELEHSEVKEEIEIMVENIVDDLEKAASPVKE